MTRASSNVEPDHDREFGSSPPVPNDAQIIDPPPIPVELRADSALFDFAPESAIQAQRHTESTPPNNTLNRDSAVQAGASASPDDRARRAVSTHEVASRSVVTPGASPPDAAGRGGSSDTAPQGAVLKNAPRTAVPPAGVVPPAPGKAAHVDRIVEQVLQTYADAAAPVVAPPSAAPVAVGPPATAPRTAAPSPVAPRAIRPAAPAASAAAGAEWRAEDRRIGPPPPPAGMVRAERTLHAVPPATGHAPARVTPPRPASTRLFPPRPSDEPHALPLQFVEDGRPTLAHPLQSAQPIPPSRAGRTRWLVALLVLLVVLQSALLVWWMRSSGPASGAASTSSVTVTSDPSGSAVVVDGSRLGVTPLTTPLPPGSHQLQVGDEAPQTITVDAGVSASMHVVLARAAAAASTGAVEITTVPPGAAITVDGVPRGVSPVRVQDLSPGTHAVTLARAGRLVRRSVTVQAGTSASLAVAMEGGGSGSGWLTVTSPVTAQIYADGALIGRTDAPRTQLAAGRHQLVLVNDALNFREERIVEVASGRTVSIQLEPVNGTLNINAQPWATVWVDGTAIGETPIGNYSLPIGSHEVILRHPELGERKQTVVVGVGSATRVGVDLRK